MPSSSVATPSSTAGVQIVNWRRAAVPATYSGRQYPEIRTDELSANLADGAPWRQVGVTGRILKGARPADLPVVQSTKLELVINVETARMWPHCARQAPRRRR
jgi:hypothetical protein